MNDSRLLANGTTSASRALNMLRGASHSITGAWRSRTQPRAAVPGREDTYATTDRWGWLPAITLSGAFGLLCVALAFTGARNVTWWNSWTELLFWGGLLLLFVPLAARLLSPHADRRERIGLVVLFGMALYLVKMLRYPLYFAFHDEFLHWRTVNDILASGHLFHDNPLLPISALYPGLEIITTALVHVSGISVFASASIILGVARLVLALALYLFYEKISRSPQVAGIAAVLYMLNPKLIYFDAQFSYESLALSFTVLILYAMVSRLFSEPHNQRGMTLVALLSLVGVVITHHVTSFATGMFLIVWALVLIVMNRRTQTEGRLSPLGITALGMVLSLAWLVYVASMVVGYLAPHIIGAVEELSKIIAGEASGRQLFRDHSGNLPPLWERITGFGATILLLGAMPFGLLQIWRRYRNDTAAVMLALTALAYPGSLAFRFTEAGGEAADRAAGTLFLSLSFVVALGITHLLATRMWARRWQALVTSALAVIFVGGIIVGAGPRWSRMPGPFLVAADSRSIVPLGIEMAKWTGEYLGPNNRVATDRIDRLLMATYGQQYPITHAREQIDVSDVFFAPYYGTVQTRIVTETHARYLAVDRRMSIALPGVGIYFEAPEQGALHHTTPVALNSLTKFDRLVNINRVYDSGDIVVYGVGEDTREP